MCSPGGGNTDDVGCYEERMRMRIRTRTRMRMRMRIRTRTRIITWRVMTCMTCRCSGTVDKKKMMRMIVGLMRPVGIGEQE